MQKSKISTCTTSSIIITVIPNSGSTCSQHYYVVCAYYARIKTAYNMLPTSLKV